VLAAAARYAVLPLVGLVLDRLRCAAGMVEDEVLCSQLSLLARLSLEGKRTIHCLAVCPIDHMAYVLPLTAPRQVDHLLYKAAMEQVAAVLASQRHGLQLTQQLADEVGSGTH
jgi:hypothetical protein